MTIEQTTQLIATVSKDRSLDFRQKVGVVSSALEKCSPDSVVRQLDTAGVIPEVFSHDSSEEKLFAKYCDELLARAWRELGLDARSIPERADAADVIARAADYAIVGDAKAFRLSRTAKNQKDFKIEALNSWRRGSDYACLVAPLYQYPSGTSQIYLQAATYGVTLLSYTHLAFLVRHLSRGTSLRPLWSHSAGLPKVKSARDYWDAVDSAMLKLTATPAARWERAKAEALALLPNLGSEQIEALEREKARIATLSKEELTRSLITALRIDAKIAVIRRATGA